MLSNLNDEGTEHMANDWIHIVSSKYLNDVGKKYAKLSSRIAIPLILIGFLIGVILSIINGP
jgi:hypothetical protein